jgi:hypothetical protein
MKYPAAYADFMMSDDRRSFFLSLGWLRRFRRGLELSRFFDRLLGRGLAFLISFFLLAQELE